MIYSCFNQKAGLYRYFQDGKQHAINADLPVPSLPKNAGRVGVASIDAARPFPSGAKPIGHGWHARGIVVQCPKGGLGAADSERSQIWLAALAVVVGVGLYLHGRSGG